MKYTAPKTTALAEFTAAKVKIDEALRILTEASDNNFSVDPDAVTWGGVGSLNHLVELLARPLEFLNLVPAEAEAR
jgi:hypothetical protein